MAIQVVSNRSNKMNILIVNIALRPDSLVKIFPVGLGYVMTAMKQAGFDFDFLDLDAVRPDDEELESYLAGKRYDVVCFGCIVTGYRYARDLAERIRRNNPDACIIAGNTVASSIPELLLEKTEVDVAVMGEGDETIVDLLHALQAKRPLSEVKGICFWDDGFCQTSARPVISNLESLPVIDRTLFDIDVYVNNRREQMLADGAAADTAMRSLHVNTARGCIHRCTFCYHSFKGVGYRPRSISSIMEEIVVLVKRYDLTHVGLADELTFFNKSRALEFAEAVLDSDVEFKWTGQCRADLFDKDEDIEIIAKMKAAGCTSGFYSLESADPEILASMNKQITVEQFSRQTQLFHRAGLPVNTSLVFGFPQETPETIARTFDVCIDNRIYPSIGFLLPQPGSGMYEYACNNGLISDEEEYLMAIGDRQDLYLNLTKMSDEEFTGEVLKGAKRCNKALGRGLDENRLVKTAGYRNK